MKNQSLRDILPKKSVIILSAVLFGAGIICYILCFTNDHLLHTMKLDMLSGVLMIAGLMLIVKNLKKPANTPQNNESNISNEANTSIEKCNQILAQVREHLYGNEDEGQEEISVTSKKLGKLIYRRKPQWYEGKCKWCGESIDIFIEATLGDAPEEILSEAEKLFDIQKALDKSIRKLAAQELNDIKQSSKCPKALSDTKSSEFAKRLRPSSVNYNSDEGFLLYYDDDLSKSDCQVKGHISQNGTLERVKIEDII